jgi:hypothetical protein
MGMSGLSPGSVVEIALEFRATLDHRTRSFLQFAFSQAASMPRARASLFGGSERIRFPTRLRWRWQRGV